MTYSILTTRKIQTEKSNEDGSTKIELPKEHVVSSGESLWSIAETYYKSGYNWVDLAKANAIANPDVIYVGQVLTIPNVPPIIVESGSISAASIQAPTHETITIQEGDTLWDIAENEYGSGYNWVEIVRLNNIQNPDLIYPTNVLRLK